MPEGLFFFNYAKLNKDDYVEKNKRMNKAHILAGAECSCAKISACKDHIKQIFNGGKMSEQAPWACGASATQICVGRAMQNTRQHFWHSCRTPPEV